ncbi:uncharacterized protein DEA37_0001615 [Paragonimus westermani]|uniref:Uncharacterized protein n=1 Tax=Paragonimus westermani TaxID=34504 RepID=A0A5J4NEN1_9TREM|nr:uncharacterized protein DEA37_0001615 [Paragonimus westermani]
MWNAAALPVRYRSASSLSTLLYAVRAQIPLRGFQTLINFLRILPSHPYTVAIKPGQTTSDKTFTLNEVECLGAKRR